MDQEPLDEGSAKARARRQMTPEERSKFGVVAKWKKDRRGTPVPPDDVSRFIDEYCLVPPSMRLKMAEYAEKNGLNYRTVQGWHTDPRVLVETNRRLSLSYEHPDTIAGIMRNLAEQAQTPGPASVKAAETYLKIIGLVKPQEVNVKVEQAPQDLSRLDTKELVSMVRELEAAQ